MTTTRDLGTLLGVWILPLAYAAAFALTRAYAIVLQPELVADPDGWYLGRALAINGFRVHHVYYGVALVGVAGVAATLVRRRSVTFLLTGVGLGLVADEIMLVATGFTAYNHPWRLPIAVAIGLGLAAVAALTEGIPRLRDAAAPRNHEA